VSTGGRHVFPRISCHFSKIASTHSGRVQIRRLEVESRFLVTPVAVSYLRSNSGGLRFKKNESLGRQTTQDTYYDRNGQLFSKGVYIRRRNGYWEAKIRTGGDFINSAFTEVDGNNAVKEVIEQNLIVSADGLSIEEMLEPCAEFVTERESWIMDGRFKVNVDTTDFGYIVGEVELTETFRSANGEHSEEKEGEKLKQEMDQDIKAFMQSYPQSIPGWTASWKTECLLPLDQR
jgi:thiamine-triphosphatase